METEIQAKTVDDVVVEIYNGCETAILRGAALVEDVELVKKYAEDHNIPCYVAIKEEADGSTKNFVLDENGNPVVGDGSLIGKNEKYVEPVKVEEDVLVEENTEVVEEAKVDTETEHETEEVVTEEVKDDTVEEVPTEEFAKTEEFEELKEILEEKIKEVLDLQAEVATLRDELETSHLKEADVLVSHETTLEEVVKFMQDNHLKTLSVE